MTVSDNRRRLLKLAAPLALAASGWARTAAAMQLPPGIGPGDPAPDIAGPSLHGPAIRLSDLRGRVVLVDFWASFCGPCIQAMPELDGIRSELHRLGWQDQFEILGVGVDDEIEKAEAFLKRVPVTYPVLSDMLGIASRRYGVWRLPASYLIDVDGRAFRVYHGFGDTFAADILKNAALLLQRAFPAPKTTAR